MTEPCGGCRSGGPGGLAGGCCRCGNSRRASPLTCLAVCFLVLTYNLLGGFLFLALEGTGAPAQDDVTAVAASQPHLAPTDLRASTVERLWSITEDLNILYKENWTKLAAKELLDFQKVLLKTARGTPLQYHDQDHDHRWTFSTSFLYALTLITTIGHGNVSPKSMAGKLVAVAYACVGIPIIMLYLSTIGEALARRVRSLYSRVRPPRRRRAAVKPPPLNEERRTPFQVALNVDSMTPVHWSCGAHTRVPMFLSVTVMALYVGAGAALFRLTERWSLLDGCFFSFASLATIGFGDLRPGRYAGTLSAKAEDVAIGICCIYILVGIVVIAMCFNLIQEDLSVALRSVAGLCGGQKSGGAVVHSAVRGRDEDKPPAPAS